MGTVNPKNENIHHMSDGAVRRYTSVGAYPLFYITKNNEVACPQAVEAHLDECTDPKDRLWIQAVAVNWETNLTCDVCGDHSIESAYGEDDES